MAIATSVVKNSKDFRCLNCGADKFFESNIKLNSRWAVLLDMEIFSKRGTSYICEKCGYNHEFFKD